MADLRLSSIISSVVMVLTFSAPDHTVDLLRVPRTPSSKSILRPYLPARMAPVLDSDLGG